MFWMCDEFDYDSLLLIGAYTDAGRRAFLDGKVNAFKVPFNSMEVAYKTGYDQAALQVAENAVANARALAAELKAKVD